MILITLNKNKNTVNNKINSPQKASVPLPLNVGPIFRFPFLIT